MRRLAIGVLVVIALAAAGADFLARAGYEEQSRELPNAAPSREHPLGTDDLGRDRMARLLHGARVSLLLAPAAALLATALAGLIGGVTVLLGERAVRVSGFFLSIVLAFPWLFLLLMVRAALPLNVPAWTSVTVTFLLLGLLGWAGGARIVQSSMRALLESGFVLAARAQGWPWWRIGWRHLVPALRPVLQAQFWVTLPGFILSEATLGLLGLGVTEPLPSLGTLTSELQNFAAVAESPWLLAPAVLLVTVLLCLRVAAPATES